MSLLGGSVYERNTLSQEISLEKNLTIVSVGSGEY